MIQNSELQIQTNIYTKKNYLPDMTGEVALGSSAVSHTPLSLDTASPATMGCNSNKKRHDF